MILKGKQLNDGALTQEKLNITTDSITDLNKVTNKDWADQNIVNHIQTLDHSEANLDMTANNTTANSGAMLACANAIIDVPQSMVIVRVNGVDVNIGGNVAPYDGFFSPDGVIIRNKGTEQQGDRLYWNTDIAIYQLDNTDKIDFDYLIKTAYAPF